MAHYHIILNTSQYGPVLFGSLGVAVTVVPISPLFTAGEVARVRETILNGGLDQRLGCYYKLRNKSLYSTDSFNQLSVFLLFLSGHAMPVAISLHLFACIAHLKKHRILVFRGLLLCFARQHIFLWHTPRRC